MSSTTQILFNSPALHSLKRDQLVKLCKIHSIKANGKNVDLIKKLKLHAETLPKDDPLSIAVRGESNEHEEQDSGSDSESDASGSKSPTPSPVDQPAPRPPMAARMSDWEVVMYSIEEEDENAETIRSTRSGNKGAAGEFGTGSSKLGTSIKSLASSLGKLKKRPKSPKSIKSSMNVETRPESPVDELEKTSQRYSSIGASGEPPVEQEPLAFNPSRMTIDGFLGEGETPLPGHALRPGVPAPANARLSLGLGLGVPATPSQPTTTIRLVGNRPQGSNLFGTNETPRLAPFKTNFDLVMGSPAPAGSVYPALTFDDLPPSLDSLVKPTTVVSPPMNDHPMGDVTDTPTKLKAPEEPFVFGSPLPKHRVSDVQFKSAAASVLEEMNKRLQEEGVEGVDTGLIERLHPGVSNYKAGSPRETKPLPKQRGAEVKEKFDQAHQQEFSKMEGIDSYAKRKAGLTQTETTRRTSVVVGKKRKSSVLAATDGPPRPIGAPRPSGTRVVSNGKRPPIKAKVVIPGAFGLDDDDDEEEEEAPEERAGKRIRIASDASETKEAVPSAAPEPELDEKAAQEKRQAIKRKLEMNKAKRRSSTGPGMHGRRSGRLSTRPSIAKPPPPKSRFGFLSSAKSLVQSVWGRSKPAQPAAAATSNAIPKPQTKPSTLLKKATPAPPKTTTVAAAATSTLKPPAKAGESTLARPTAASSARSRSPIPSFGNTAPSVRSSLSQQASGKNSLLGTTRKGSVIGTATSRVSSAHVSSIGTRTAASSARSSAVGSMGTRASAAAQNLPSAPTHPPGARSSNVASTSSRMSTSSRLFAPTASSLAKMSRQSSTMGLKAVVEHGAAPPPSLIPVRSPPPSSSAGHSRNNSLTGGVIQPPAATPAPTAETPKPASGALETITNTAPGAKAAGVRSPRSPGFTPVRGKIFSQPLQMPSETPLKRTTVPLKSAPESIVSPPPPSKVGEIKATPVRQRSLNGRKPRISRSKVIARLASQRENAPSASASGPGAAGPSAGGTPAAAGERRKSAFVPKHGAKARSSLGAKVARSSLGPAKARVSSGGSGAGVLLSAKKRARQSEYYNRRRSRGEGLAAGQKMDVES